MFAIVSQSIEDHPVILWNLNRFIFIGVLDGVLDLENKIQEFLPLWRRVFRHPVSTIKAFVAHNPLVADLYRIEERWRLIWPYSPILKVRVKHISVRIDIQGFDLLIKLIEVRIGERSGVLVVYSFSSYKTGFAVIAHIICGSPSKRETEILGFCVKGFMLTDTELFRLSHDGPDILIRYFSLKIKRL